MNGFIKIKLNDQRGCENCKHLNTRGCDEPCDSCIWASFIGEWHPKFEPWEEDDELRTRVQPEE